MGAQNTKERTINVGTHSIRTARTRPRVGKDGRQTVSNIFTEHSGKFIDSNSKNFNFNQ